MDREDWRTDKLVAWAHAWDDARFLIWERRHGVVTVDDLAPLDGALPYEEEVERAEENGDPWPRRPSRRSAQVFSPSALNHEELDTTRHRNHEPRRRRQRQHLLAGTSTLRMRPGPHPPECMCWSCNRGHVGQGLGLPGNLPDVAPRRLPR